MYYHVWLRVEGGSQAVPNLTRAAALADVVVPFINKQVRLVDYCGPDTAVLNFAHVAYLAVLETEDELPPQDAGAQGLYTSLVNNTRANCTRQLLQEAWASRAEDGSKSLIQRALAPPRH
jgi:hypothetical protein